MNNLVIPENTPPGTIVYTLEASDPENSSIRYDIYGTDVLKVDHISGNVTVVKPLDYEVSIVLSITCNTFEYVRYSLCEEMFFIET